MFRPKSIFFKYIGTFMLINVLVFAFLTATISAIVNSYGTNMKTTSLSNAANSAAVYIENDFNSQVYPNYDTYLEYEEEGLCLLLDLLSVNDGNMLMFLTDSEGQVIHMGGAEGLSLDGATAYRATANVFIPEEISKALQSGEHISRSDSMDGFFNSDHIYYAIPLFDNGEYAGSVFAAVNSTGTDMLLSTMTRTVTLSVLWIMLASLIAVYFITERFTTPLREMSRAARSFARGQFDARVEVTGNDEVAELCTAFNNMAASLQTLEEMRRSFLANVSHDLRTPMTTISGFIDGILDGAIPPEQHEYYLGVIASEVRRLSRLVSSLLDISRIEAGERQFTHTVYDICEQGREIIISNVQRLEDRGLDVRFEADSDNMYVLADKDAIHQIFYNICDNAIKFSRPGGVYEIRITEKGGTVTVSVYNEGEGIPAEDIPFIFERFYKSDKSRGRDKTGVGLGMYISRAIIEAHGQKIWVESEEGKWCRFSFTLQSVKNDAKDKKQ